MNVWKKFKEDVMSLEAGTEKTYPYEVNDYSLIHLFNDPIEGLTGIAELISDNSAVGTFTIRRL